LIAVVDFDGSYSWDRCWVQKSPTSHYIKEMSVITLKANSKQKKKKKYLGTGNPSDIGRGI
jgi:hypothetical protein